MTSADAAEPSAAFQFTELFAGAVMRAMPRPLAVDVLRELAEALREGEETVDVITMSHNASAKQRAKRQALAELRRVLPALLRMINPADT